jgi:lambda repressor-like predicted transcriptional regulator
MTPTQLQKELKDLGYTNAALATEYGVHRSMVTNVIKHTLGSHPLRSFLASKVGLKPDAIWPEKYKNGLPRKPGRYPFYG